MVAYLASRWGSQGTGTRGDRPDQVSKCAPCRAAVVRGRFTVDVFAPDLASVGQASAIANFLAKIAGASGGPSVDAWVQRVPMPMRPRRVSSQRL